MKEDKKITGLKKRQLIDQAGKMVFLWVAAASIVAAITIVLSQFMITKAMFNNKVLTEKYATERTLKNNVNVAEELKSEVQKLIGDTNLTSVRAKPTDNNLKVVLDALPTKGEPLALGSSMQLVVLQRSGVTIESLATDDEIAAAAEGDAAGVVTGSPTSPPSQPQEIPFTFTIIGSFEQVRNALADIEKTIRPIHVTAMTVEGSDASLKVTAQAKAYYQPSKSVKLQKKTIQP